MAKIAIIGAGLSGLSAARLLKNHAEITVFEKSRGVSGRMSTRRVEPYLFDHGAQYFTARTKPFQELIKPLISSGAIERWNARYAKFDGDRAVYSKTSANDEARYVAVPGMSSLGKYLADGLNVNLNTRVTSLKQDAELKWQISDENGKLYEGFDWVISTVPSPQALQLVPSGFKYRHEIEGVRMRPCFALMLGFSERFPLEFDSAHVKNSDLGWIAVNSSKPGRGEHLTLTVHSSPDFAENHINADSDEVMERMCAETSRIVGRDVTSADCKSVHRWMYAMNANAEKCPVMVDEEMKIAVCGDWCLGGRVEAAFTSAYHLANALKDSLS